MKDIRLANFAPPSTPYHWDRCVSAPVQVENVAALFRSLPRLAEQDPETLVPGFYRMDAQDFPLREMFAPGCYVREIVMPEGALIIGKQHRTEHFNIVLEGAARVMMDGEIHDIHAPAIFVSKPGVRKVLYIDRTCRWATVHPTTETDPDKLRELLVCETDAETEHRLNLDAQRLKAIVEQTERSRSCPG